MQRPFYIIAHNPNRVNAAMTDLRDGANALEPDVQYDLESGQFLVDEFMPSDPGQP